MPRYYFDLRDGDDLAVDEEGVELRDMELVQEEAARSLADMARDAVRTGHEIVVQPSSDVDAWQISLTDGSAYVSAAGTSVVSVRGGDG